MRPSQEGGVLKISPVQMEALADDGLQRFALKVDAWLTSVSPAWAGREAGPRQDVLQDVVELGRLSRMEVEIDYALFAWILVHLRGDWQAFVKRPKVKDLLTCENNARAKVRGLYDMAQGELIVHG
jgi:hypothetical protein